MSNRVYSLGALDDHNFYMAHRADILAAVAEGRIVRTRQEADDLNRSNGVEAEGSE